MCKPRFKDAPGIPEWITKNNGMGKLCRLATNFYQ
jgi:hypothetical protein